MELRVGEADKKRKASGCSVRDSQWSACDTLQATVDISTNLLTSWDRRSTLLH